MAHFKDVQVEKEKVKKTDWLPLSFFLHHHEKSLSVCMNLSHLKTLQQAKRHTSLTVLTSLAAFAR